jgi:hypothetical protein
MPISGHYLRGQLLATLILFSSAIMCITFGVAARLILTPKGCHQWLQPDVRLSTGALRRRWLRALFGLK